MPYSYMQVPFYYFIFGGNERRNAVVVYFASVPFFLAWVSLFPNVSFPSQWSCWVLWIIPVSTHNFCMIFFFFNSLRLHINNEHWWVPQGMAAFLSHMRSAKWQDKTGTDRSITVWLGTVSGQGHSLESSLKGLFFQSTRGLSPLRTTEWLSLLQKRPPAAEHNPAHTSLAACTVRKQETALPELMPITS